MYGYVKIMLLVLLTVQTVIHSRFLVSAANADNAEKCSVYEEAVYLGVLHYGTGEACAEGKNDFIYRFACGESEQLFSIDNGLQDKTGVYDYPLQNKLKEGYEYRIGISEGKVISADEIVKDSPSYMPPVKGSSGLRTIRNFLQTALEPVGTTLYVYGGGWNWQDTGASVQARTLGISSDWVRFFEEHDADYTYRDRNGDPSEADPPNSYYPYGGYNEYYYAGLDCSGYLGWVVYNTFETENGKDGYVVEASRFAKKMEDLGWGTRNDGNPVSDLKPGDIISMDSHVWICMGICTDGSIICLHSTPGKSRRGQPGGGVQLSALGYDRTCEAYCLADRCMSSWYPEWYERYEVLLRDPAEYLYHSKETAGVFSWNIQSANGLTDPDGILNMDPETILDDLLGERNKNE